MWVCVDSRGCGVTGQTPDEAFNNYENEIDVSEFDALEFYNLSELKPIGMKMAIVPIVPIVPENTR